MDCPTCSTAAPVTIRTVDDINASDKQISWLAARAAAAILNHLDNQGHPSQIYTYEAVVLVAHVLRSVLIDEPATGEAVDIAGNRFESYLHRHLLGFALTELGDSKGEA